MTPELTGRLRLRPSRADDAGGIVAVMQRSWQAAYAKLIPQELTAQLTPEVRERALQEERASPERGRAEWVAEQGGQILAYLSCGAGRDGDAGAADGEIFSLYVVPEAWRLGLGRRLVDRALEHLFQHGFERVGLWCLTTNRRGRGFYEALGFTVDVPEDAKTMKGFNLPHTRHVLDLRTTRLRPARIEDAGAVAAIGCAAWNATYHGLVPQELIELLDLERRAESFVALLEHPRRTAWVIESGGEVVGYASSGSPQADASVPEAAMTGEVYALYLRPDAVGRGLGRRLFRRALDDLRDRGFTRVVVWLLTENDAARRFYAREGLGVDIPEKKREHLGFELFDTRMQREL